MDLRRASSPMKGPEFSRMLMFWPLRVCLYSWRMVLNGKSEAMIQYKGYTVSRLYLRHDSEATVCISEFAHVTIDCFDNTRLVVATVGSDAQVLLNVYGQAQVKATGDGIKVNYKHKNTI